MQTLGAIPAWALFYRELRLTLSLTYHAIILLKSNLRCSVILSETGPRFVCFHQVHDL